jgi:cytochrome P450
MTPSIVKIVSIALLLLFIVRRIRAYRRLAHIPGPKYRGWSRIPQALHNISGRQHEYLTNINRKYGKLARIGPNHLISSDPEILMRINATGSPYRRSAFYTCFRFEPRKDNIVSQRDENIHTELRRKMALGYGGKDVPFIEQLIEKHVDAWVDLIQRKYLSTNRETKPLDLGEQSQYFTVDVITELAFDRPFGNLKDDEDKYEYTKATKYVLSFAQLLTLFPEVYSWIEQSRLIDLIAPTRKDKKGLGPAMAMTKEAIGERFEKPELQNKKDMLGAFLRHGLTQEQATIKGDNRSTVFFLSLFISGC